MLEPTPVIVIDRLGFRNYRAHLAGQSEPFGDGTDPPAALREYLRKVPDPPSHYIVDVKEPDVVR